MRFDILTIFPGFFAGPFDHGVLKRAIATGLVQVETHDLREYTHDRHRTVDDRPFGGGEGMVLKPEPIWECFSRLDVATKLERDTARETVVLLSAQGTPFTQAMAHRLAACGRVVLLCGRYEGIDERINEMLCDQEVSIGDYVLSGGELAAAVILDAVARLLPGVLGNPDSARFESFGAEAASLCTGDRTADGVPSSVHLAGGLLDYPHYTRPAEFLGQSVPEVLQQGDHEAIRRWRRRRALEKTWRNRPDLLQEARLTREDEEFLERLGSSSGSTARPRQAVPDELAKRIRGLEESMLQAAFRKDSSAIAALLTEDFVEFGSSGRTFDKAAVLRELREERPAERALREFAAVLLAADMLQATYISTRKDAEEEVESLRCSIWVRRDGGWKLRFHQGTLRGVSQTG